MGPWVTDNCHKGIQVSVKNLGHDEHTNNYWWNVRFKNNYNRKVHFSFSYTIDGESTINRLRSVAPGETSTYTSVPYKSSKSNGTGNISKVCFFENYMMCGSTLGSGMCYAECDNGTPNIPLDCGANTANAQTNSSAQTNASETINYNSQINKLLQEKVTICQSLCQSQCGTTLCLKTEADYMTRLVGTESQIESGKKEIVSEIQRDIYDIKAVCRDVKS